MVAQYLPHRVLPLVGLLSPAPLEMGSVAILVRPLIVQYCLALVTALTVTGPRFHAGVVVSMILFLLLVSNVAEYPVQARGSARLAPAAMKPKTVEYPKSI